MQPVDNNELKEYAEKLKQALNLDFGEAIDNAIEGARRLNDVFGGTKQRVTELMQAVSDTAPGIFKLGGDIENVFSTMEEVSKATRRNIVASGEDAVKLYAAQKVLGDSVRNIVDNFSEVGIQYSKIGSVLEESIKNISSLGMNVRDVMSDVSRNIEKINEFNFSNGVAGLAKMAAHASLFKFDMNETFRVAEKALSPDGAIELASAFQRMGVAVGQLTDPFQLMNMSLNDPEGLQRSLANIGKQYTEFDEKTKSFKINPAGMLQMRELAQQTNMNYQNLVRSAEASANLDRALKQVSPEINFGSESDRELLGAIATMDKSGEFQVNVKNEFGKDIPTKLSELNQEQYDKLIEEQKKQPKTLEDIAKSQLTTTDDTLAEVRAINAKITGGVTSADQIRGFTASLSEFLTSSFDTIEQAIPKTEEIRPEVTEGIANIQKIMSSLSSDGLNKEKVQAGIKSLEEQLDKLAVNAGGTMGDVVEKIKNKAEKIYQEAGYLKLGSREEQLKKTKIGATTQKSTIDMTGEVSFKIDSTTAGLNKTELENFVNSTEFKQKIYQLIKDVHEEKEKSGKKSY